jgi:hypothetical protein
MNCCGQKRQAWREQGIIKVQTRNPSPPVLQNPSVLYHLGETSLLINGMVTGYTYLFAGQGTGLNVDEQDLPGFLSTEFFVISLPKIEEIANE